MDLQLKGRTALVTGAGRGIGREICLALAKEGVAVGLVARTRTELDGVAAEIRAAGGRAAVAAANVAEKTAVEAAIEVVRRVLGPVDILVNNAGGNTLGRIAEMDEEVWWKQIEVNLRGPYFFSRALVPQMVERRWGRIINISSVAGKVGMMYCTAYCSAKHAMLGFTKALALEVADKGVTVNAVCPGFVETELTRSTTRQRSELFGQPEEAIRKAQKDRSPMKVSMTSEEIVPAVLFLASEGSRRTTGEAINVSCGSVMH